MDAPEREGSVSPCTSVSSAESRDRGQIPQQPSKRARVEAVCGSSRHKPVTVMQDIQFSQGTRDDQTHSAENSKMRAALLALKERRAELEEATEELDAARTTAKTLAMQLKSSRCAEEEERSACAALRNRVEASQASQREVLASIGEDMRAVSRDTELLRLRLATTHTELAESRTLLDETQAAGRSLEKRRRAESAALVDAHAKRCKLRTEAESARAEAVAQRTSFAGLEESKSRLISELEELMTCSCQSGSKLDEAKRVSSSLQVEVNDLRNRLSISRAELSTSASRLASAESEYDASKSTRGVLALAKDRLQKELHARGGSAAEGNGGLLPAADVRTMLESSMKSVWTDVWAEVLEREAPHLPARPQTVEVHVAALRTVSPLAEGTPMCDDPQEESEAFSPRAKRKRSRRKRSRSPRQRRRATERQGGSSKGRK